MDIAGLVKGASKGEGLGNQFLANIREVDAIVHVVRCFEDGNIVHVDGSINPLRDIETINLELIFSDLEILERRIAKTTKVARNDKTAAKELALLEKIKAHLEEGRLAKTFEGAEDEEELAWLTGYNLLTYKPVIYAANVAEDDLANDGAGNSLMALEQIRRAVRLDPNNPDYQRAQRQFQQAGQTYQQEGQAQGFSMGIDPMTLCCGIWCCGPALCACACRLGS